MLKLFLIFAALQLADLGTTIAVFRLGGIEQNPLVRSFMVLGPVAGLALAKALALAIGLGCFLRSKYRTLFLANVIFTGIILWNVSVIVRLA